MSRRLDQLDKYPELKSFYLIMDNALIHPYEEIDNLIIREVTDVFISLSTHLAWILSNSFGLLLRTEWSIVDLKKPTDWIVFGKLIDFSLEKLDSKNPLIEFLNPPTGAVRTVKGNSSKKDHVFFYQSARRWNILVLILNLIYVFALYVWYNQG